MASLPERQFTNLVNEIAAQGLSLRGFALKHGIDKSWLSRLINGQVREKLDMTLVRKLAKATDNRIGRTQVAAYLDRLDALDDAERARKAKKRVRA